VKRTVAAGALLLSLLPVLLGASPDLPEIQAQGVLRVLVIIDDEVQFFSGRPGADPGFDYEILEGFARGHRLRLELVRGTSWDALIPMLLQGRGDVIAGRFTATEARRKTIDFTSDVFPTRNVVVTRKPHRVVRSLDELRQEKVSVLRGSSMAELLATLGLPPANLDLSVPTGGIPRALREGKISCTVQEIHTAIVNQKRDGALQLGLFIGPPVSLAYGVRKSDGQLLTALNDHLQAVRQSGMWNRLVVKYFGDAALDILQKARAE
jgi:ABC-type amino acid transport substrate-binding protein